MIGETCSNMLATHSMRYPAEPFSPADEVFRFAQLMRFSNRTGERGYVLDGWQYGFETLSFVIIEARADDGPPLHTHPYEAAHIVLSGTMAYVLGDQRFTVAGPYVVRIPASVPHTFLNLGDQPICLVAAFATKRLSWNVLGSNPLITM